MKTTLRSFLPRLITTTALAVLSICTALQSARAEESKPADVAGTWTWSVPGRNGGPERKSTLKLKVEGSKLTGKVESPGRDGSTRETAIEDGKINGSEVSFKVTREFNGNKMVIAYQGKVSGDTIKGKAESERDGQKNSRDWEAKRETEKK